MTTDGVPRRDAATLRRFMQPRSVALVGLSESAARPRYAVTALKQSDLDVFVVHPRNRRVFDLETYPSLSAAGRPVDAVLCLVNAQASLGIVAEAARIGAGGVVVNAAGFSEIGSHGVSLQRQLL